MLLVVCSVLVYKRNESNHCVSLDDILLVNVEALAVNEIFGSGSKKVLSAVTEFQENGVTYKCRTMVDCEDGGDKDCKEGVYIKEGKHWLDETDSLLYEYRHLTHSGICGGLLSLGVFAFSSYPFLFLEFILAFLALLVACAIDYRKVWIRVTVLVLEKKAKVESTAIRQMREEVKKLLEEKE